MGTFSAVHGEVKLTRMTDECGEKRLYSEVHQSKASFFFRAEHSTELVPRQADERRPCDWETRQQVLTTLTEAPEKVLAQLQWQAVQLRVCVFERG